MNDKTHPIDLSNAYYNKNNNNIKNYNNNSNNISFFKYFYLLVNKWFMKLLNIENEIIVHIKNSINIALTRNGTNMSYWYYVLNNDTEREYLINLGALQAKKFINNLEYNTTPITINAQVNTQVNTQVNAQVNTQVETQVNTQVVSNLVDNKILYLLNMFFKSVSYIFYIYFIVILYLFYKNIKI